MNTAQEWQYLKIQLREQDYSAGIFDNQFFRCLLDVLRDEAASLADQLLAYRDALLSANTSSTEELPSQFDSTVIVNLLERFGLGIMRNGGIFLKESNLIDDLELTPVYRLVQRRFIHAELLDPALKTRLKDSAYMHYNGKAQQLAVRLAITGQRQSTLIVNLPTGCGKTLVAQAASLYANDSQLTLVIVPTIGLAIEQGTRAHELLKKAGRQHGGLYYWHGGQTQEQHNDIKNRIREQQQRVLFCSPEAACRSLLPILFRTAASNLLSCVVIDEAHIVDQWGTEFRPYFQIIASLIRALRKVSTEGIKCILMSATFTEKSMNLVRELFGIEGQDCIHVNGCFLRPEIQYCVKKVSAREHLKNILNAVVALPKPMIIYTIYPDEAERIHSEIRLMGLTRVGLFTGRTSTRQREDLVRNWSNRELDIMVATSAFGLGMDKADIRSVIHAAVPENLDRFYQEVGRGGRDGLASQSLLIYFDEQVAIARNLNNNRLITIDLGLEKWRAMWQHGSELSDGRRKVHVSTLRGDQQNRTEGNEEWNWRTLLLMQRAGLIQIELEEPYPPSIDPSTGLEEYHAQLGLFYDNYYDNVTITPIRDDHLDKAVWEQQTQQRRSYEKIEQNRGFEILLDWLRFNSEKSLCDLLISHYTLEEIQPEYACGGCPKCLRSNPYVESPTVGKSVCCSGVQLSTHWRPLIRARELHQYIYYPRGTTTQKRLLRSWVGWIVRLIESGTILALCADFEVLKTLQSELAKRTNAFWIGDLLYESATEPTLWPKLILIMDLEHPIPDLGWSDSTKILVAPKELTDINNNNRKWWQSVSRPVSLDNYLRGFRQ